MVAITTNSVTSLIPKRVGGKVMASRGGRKSKQRTGMSRSSMRTSMRTRTTTRGGRKRRK